MADTISVAKTEGMSRGAESGEMEQRPTPPKTTTNTIGESVVKPDGYSYRIPIRMTREERARIGQKAQAANLSMSRYLVTSAMYYDEQERHETDLSEGDQTRLRRFQSYFDEAATRLRSLSALPIFKGPGGDEMQRAARLRETLCVLESLSTEISRRLP